MENLNQTEQVQSLEQPAVEKVDFMNHFNFKDDSKTEVVIEPSVYKALPETVEETKVEVAVEQKLESVKELSLEEKAEMKNELENSYMADVRVTKIVQELQQVVDTNNQKINKLNQEIKENDIRIKALEALLN